MIWSPFSSRTASQEVAPPTASKFDVVYTETEIQFRVSTAIEPGGAERAPIDHSADVFSFLCQLEEEGVVDQSNGGFVLPWERLFPLLSSEPHGDVCSLLGLPKVQPWRPVLSSKGTLTDSDFSIGIAGWIAPNAKPFAGNVSVTGAFIRAGLDTALLPEGAWATTVALARLRRTSIESRTPESNKKAWALIRSSAIRAGADLSDFLKKTVVLTPEKLDIKLRKGSPDAPLVEIIPRFKDAPPRWIELFDRSRTVMDRYEIPDGDGLTHVLLSPEVRTVLEEIKRIPGRRIAGERAEAFIRNPFAALGPDAEKVIDPDQFEKARTDAGIAFARFTARVLRDPSGYPYEVALLVEEALAGEIKSEEVPLTVQELEKFLSKLESRIGKNAQCCVWGGYELEILGDTPDQAKLLREALRDLTSPNAYRASELFDISNYSSRVGGLGIEERYYSPFIARKSDDGDGWFPDNILFGIYYTPVVGGETVALAMTEETFGEFRREAEKAREEGRKAFSFPGCSVAIEVPWAEEVISSIGNAKNDIDRGTFLDPKKRLAGDGNKVLKGLVLKPNINTLDHAERRGKLTPPPNLGPHLPKTLKSEIRLLDHQLSGVAWLQHLWMQSPDNCRGLILADDMGLGKTLQLLTFIASVIEQQPDTDPFLVVAPVSLLENWKEEIEKFFKEGSLQVLTLYGPALADKRLPRSALEEELLREGITRLLVRNWLGNAKIVLTTYETLRDLEFSLAIQKWAAVICDEAQKIKNPNAMVTRAAKKQNARLKIVCTGTPVENTLTDLWCLFDFVQPGLLGALRDFGERYRKPIESETEEEQARLVELRALIDPQLLRRTKGQVAKDLPQKTEWPGCRRLPISERQRLLYADAIKAFKSRTQDGAGTGLQSHLGLIQYLRKLCSDPRPRGQIARTDENLSDIESHSPKMAWLLRQLEVIRDKDEKAILFCEFRDLQRVLQRAIMERFDILPDIINGDTSAAATNANNRQKRISAYQKRPGFGVIILSPLAVGFGVNIQAANHVIHFTRTWNPAKEDQATDRAYRIGQTKEVFVYYPVVWADDFVTFDAKLDKLLDWKREISKDILNGSGDLSAADFGDLGDPGGGSAFGSVSLTVDDMLSLNPDAFEAFCAALWSKLGYSKTYRTPQAGDGGVDVVAIKGEAGVLIQCKSSSVDGQELGWEAVKDVVGGAAAYSVKHTGVKFALVAATNRTFNGAARSQAIINHVKLVDGEDLRRMLTETPISRAELNQLIRSA